MRRLWDISPPLTPELAVFPGDTPLDREVLLRREDGDSVTLSTLRASAHLGAHVDAPLHYGTGAKDIASVPLGRLLGACRVVRPRRPGSLREGRVTRGALEAAAAAQTPLPPRVLIATGSHPEPERWTDDFTALSADAVDWLAAVGVRTVGIDTPSIDPARDEELTAHAAALRHGMTILEGLRLDDVPEGDYELIALPLRLVGFDGSPVRAVLRALE
ncbi:MAG: arylformamidase [Gemmatimonadota bacterium]|nr:arylformamidase [Gemmatimonadota bacterium]